MTNYRFTSTRLKNLISTLNEEDTQASLNWYKEAHTFATELMIKHNLNLRTICKVIAVLSPSVTWEQNKKDTSTIIKAYLAGDSINSFTVSTYGNNKLLAWGILNETDDLTPKATNPKTYSFYENIFNPYCSRHVTIDRWAIKALTTKKSLYGTPLRGKLYKESVKVYKRLAQEMNLLPNQVQALAWVVIRGKVN